MSQMGRIYEVDVIYGRDGRDDCSGWEGCVCYERSVIDAMDGMGGKDGMDDIMDG